MDTTTPVKITPEWFTLGELARHFDTTDHKIKYAIAQHRVEPAKRVGIFRIWSTDQLPQIESALRRVASNRGAGR